MSVMDAPPPPYTATSTSTISSTLEANLTLTASSSPRPIIYQLRQASHKNQSVIPIYSPVNCSLPIYSIKRKSTVNLSKAPNFTITPQTLQSADSKEPGLRGQQATSHVYMIHKTTFPYVPRALVKYDCPPTPAPPSGRNSTLQLADQEMAMASFRNLQWSFPIDGVPHSWCLLYNPVCLTLVNQLTGAIRATFLYSTAGTGARGGAEAGRFEIPGLLEDGGIDAGFLVMVFATASVVIAYGRDCGRVLINKG